MLRYARVFPVVWISTAMSFLSVPDTEPEKPVTVTIDSAKVAAGVKEALGDPARFNWEEVKVESLDVAGGTVHVDFQKDDKAGYARVRGDSIFAVTAKGKGDRDSSLDIEFQLIGLDAEVPLDSRTAEVEAELRVISRESCRVWTRAKHVKNPFGRVTFRITAIPLPFDVKLRCKLDVEVRKNGDVVLIPRSYRPVNGKDKIDIKISGQKLPDGDAVIRPLDAETTRIDMDIPFDAGDRTIKNPLRAAFEKVRDKEFKLGTISG